MLLRLFAIFLCQLCVPPCYNPIEIQSMPPRCFLAGKQEPDEVSTLLRSPPNGDSR